LDRIEHVMAGWIEQSRKELAEHRALWRDTQRQLNELSQRMLVSEERWEATRAEMVERDHKIRAEMAERDRKTDEQIQAIRAEMADRDRRTDARIQALVSAVGALIERFPAN
jgi:hypothetical protein